MVIQSIQDILMIYQVFAKIKFGWQAAWQVA